ncbi:MAG: porin [Halofilum sp. (in: g-proteobacteria)]
MDRRATITVATVAGLCAGPAMAQESDLLDVYGRVNVGIQHVNDEGVGTYGQDEGFGLFDVSSRVGVQGEHEVNDDLTAMYRYEFAVDATDATIDDGDRLSWVGLEGDFGRFKAGRMWSAWYEYLGWNTDRSQFWGGTGYYGYGATQFFNVGPTTRSSDTVQYTFGGGGYSDDPFTFSVEARMAGDSAGASAEGDAVEDVDLDFDGTETTEEVTADPQAFDVVTLAAQSTLGGISVNAAFRQTQSNYEEQDIEPSQAGIGLRWGSGPLYVGGSYIVTDRDDGSASDSPSMVEVLASYDFGDGLSTQLSTSRLDNDTANDAGDTTGFFALVDHQMTEQLNAYVELQLLDAKGEAGDDNTPQVVLTGMGYSF